MAKPRSKPQLALDSAAVWDTGDDIAADDWCRVFYDAIRSKLDDADYADLYEEGGREPISPSLLVCITLLQHMQRVSDRQAVEQTIRSRDWRIALGLGSAWRRFCPTVLVRFRQRLKAHGKESLVFDSVLERLRELGLLDGRRRVRIDATRVLANVERLSRADALHEAVRKTVWALARRAPQLEEHVGFASLQERYPSPASWLGTGAGHDPARLCELGRDAVALLALCRGHELAEADTLATMLAENFVLTEDADPVPLPAEALPIGRIATPHEPDAQVGAKAGEQWLGDKAQIVETADTDRPNFIVEVVSTAPTVDDSTMAIPLLEATQEQLPEVEAALTDGAYASVRNGIAARELGVDLIAPARPACSRNAVKADEFEYDFAARQARCPQGQVSTVWRESKTRICIRFPAALCRACPLFGSCTKSEQGRSLQLSAEHEQLTRDRARTQTEEFKAAYRARAPIEATISQLVRRCGFRKSRYRGAKGRALHVQCAAAALNVVRLVAAVAAGQVPGAGAVNGACGQRVDVFPWLVWVLSRCLMAAQGGSKRAAINPKLRYAFVTC